MYNKVRFIDRKSEQVLLVKYMIAIPAAMSNVIIGTHTYKVSYQNWYLEKDEVDVFVYEVVEQI